MWHPQWMMEGCPGATPSIAPLKTLGTIGGCLVVARGVAAFKPLVGIKQVALGQHEVLS
jgi:hypothetical protein